MKKIRRMIAWIVLSLILQSVLYIYLDKFYFTDETSVKIIQMGDNSTIKNITPDINLTQGAKSIDLSYDGSYVSYLDADGALHIYNTNSRKLYNIQDGTNAKYLTSKWLPDADILIIAEMLNSGKGKIIRFYSYDAVKDEKRDIGDPTTKAQAIAVKNMNSEAAIEVSTLTGVMYVKVIDGKISHIYRIDRNEKMTRENIPTREIGTFKVSSHDDLFAYEDLLNNRIMIVSGKHLNVLRDKSHLCLLASDGNNNVYVGSIVNGEIDKIYFGKLSDQFSVWKNITLKNPVEPKNIIVTQQGRIYINSGNEVAALKGGNAIISYNGSLVEVSGNYIASVYGGKLVLTRLNG